MHYSCCKLDAWYYLLRKDVILLKHQPQAVVVMIAHFFFSLLYSCASLFVLLPVKCSIPIINVFFYSNIFGSNCFSLEYSSHNIPLYYLTFHCLLLPSISFVISLTINVYKPHSSLLYFPTLVYLVLLASINPLVTSSGFWQVSTLLLSRCFLFEPLNPWSISVWDCYIESPSTSTCAFVAGRTLDPTRSTLVLTQAKHNKRLACLSMATIE